MPRGELQLEVSEHGPEFSFTATNFDWLVVSGSHGVLQGTGKVDEMTSFRFRAIAEHLPDGDRFQIRIWNTAGSFEKPTFAVSGKLIDGEIRLGPRSED